MYFCNFKPALSADSYFAVTIATVHRFVTTGFKGYFGILAALGTFCRKHLPSYKVPKHVVIARALPKNAAGKVMKEVLREQEKGLPQTA